MRRILTWMIMLTLLLLLPTSSFATSYYLNTSGSNANAGTSQVAPWKTLDRIFQKAYLAGGIKPGDVVRLKRGNVFEGQIRLTAKGTAALPVVLGAFGEGPPPVVRGDCPSLVWQPVVGQVGVYVATTGEGSVAGAVYEGGVKLKAVSLGTLNLSTAAGVAAYVAKLTPGSYGPPTSTNRWWVKTLAGGPSSAIHFFNTGLYVDSSTFVRVEDLDFTRTFTGIDVSLSSNIVVHGCRVSDTLNIGVYLRSGDTACTVEQCATQRTAGDGLYVLKGTDCVFRDNVVQDVSDHVLGYVAGADHCGIGLQESLRTLVERNLVARAFQSGIDYYLDLDSVVQDNVVVDTPRGIFPHGSGCKVQGNHIRLSPSTNGGGINAVSTGRQITVQDNTITMAGGWGMLATATSGPVTVRRNTIYSSNPLCKVLVPTGPVVSEKNVLVVVAAP